MRKVLCLLFLVAGMAQALPTKPVSFDFQGITVVGFMQATFKSLLNRDYVISPEVLSLDRKITVAVRNVDPRDVAAFVENVLAGQGVAVVEKNGVYYVNLAKPEVPGPVLPAPGVAGASVDPFTPASSPAKPDQPAPMIETNASVYTPVHRPAEFIVAALVSVFGSSSASSSGPLVVLTGTVDQIAKSRALAGALDQAIASVDVSVSWVEVARSEGSARGITLAATVAGARLGLSLGSTSANGTVSIRGTNFQLVLDALNTDGRFKQVSNSRIVGDDRLPMTLTVGDETPTVSSTGKDNQGNAIQSIVYRPSGVITNVTPRVLGGGRIALAIEGQISSFKPTLNGVSGSPTLIKREVKTGVTLAAGEVLMIGGLSDEVSNDSKSGLSFLPASWSVKNSTGLKTDLVLIVSAKTAQ